jgi:hypothetical protein
VLNCLSDSLRYSPGWALTASTTSLHCSLSLIFSFHPFTSIFKSLVLNYCSLKCNQLPKGVTLLAAVYYSPKCNQFSADAYCLRNIIQYHGYTCSTYSISPSVYVLGKGGFSVKKKKTFQEKTAAVSITDLFLDWETNFSFENRQKWERMM